MPMEDVSLKRGVALLPRWYQCFLIVLSVYLTENERKLFAPIITALHPGVHTEAILGTFIGFENLRREGPLTVICIGALVVLAVFMILRVINAHWNSLLGVFSGKTSQEGGELRTSPRETSTFPLQLVFVIIICDVLWINYIPFQYQTSATALSHYTPGAAHMTLVERLFLNAHVVMEETHDQRQKQHFIYALVPLLSFDILWPRIRQVLIFILIHVLVPFAVSALTALTYASGHPIERNTLRAIRVFTVIRAIVAGLSGVFLSQIQETISNVAEYQSIGGNTEAITEKGLRIADRIEIFVLNRYKYMISTGLLCCLCFVILSARLSVLNLHLHPKKDVFADTRDCTNRFSIAGTSRRRICANRQALCNVFLILLFPYFVGFGLLWAIYCLQLLLPKIISVGFHFMLFACFSSAILVSNFEFLALVSSAIAVACYYSLGHGLLGCITKYISFSLGFLIMTYWAAVIRWIFADARNRRIARMILLAVLIIPTCALAGCGMYLHASGQRNGRIQDALHNSLKYYVSTYDMSDVIETFTQQIPETLGSIFFGEIRTVAALRFVSTIVYRRIFSLDVTLAFWVQSLALLVILTMVIRMARGTAYGKSVWIDSRKILVSSCKHCGVFQSVRLVRRALRTLPVFSSMPAYIFSFVSLAALLVMIGLQQDVDTTVIHILSNILP